MVGEAWGRGMYGWGGLGIGGGMVGEVWGRGRYGWGGLG